MNFQCLKISKDVFFVRSNIQDKQYSSMPRSMSRCIKSSGFPINIRWAIFSWLHEWQNSSTEISTKFLKNCSSVLFDSGNWSEVVVVSQMYKKAFWWWWWWRWWLWWGFVVCGGGSLTSGCGPLAFIYRITIRKSSSKNFCSSRRNLGSQYFLHLPPLVGWWINGLTISLHLFKSWCVASRLSRCSILSMRSGDKGMLKFKFELNCFIYKFQTSSKCSHPDAR